MSGDGFIADDEDDGFVEDDEAELPPRVIQMPVQRIEGDPDGGFEAFLRSAAQGPTLRAGDELSSRITPEYKKEGIPVPRWTVGEGAETTQRADEAADIPREYAAGSADRDMTEAMRSDLRQDRSAYKDVPWYRDPSIMGEVSGGLATAAALPVGESAAAAGAGYGAVSGYAGSERDDLAGQLGDTATGAVTGLALGKVADDVVAPVVGWGADKVRALSDALGWKANINRVASTMPGSELKKLVANKGEDYIQKLGEAIEKPREALGGRGMHEGDGMLGFLPQPKDTYAANANIVNDDALARMTSAEDEIARGANPNVDLRGLASDLRSNAGEARGMIDPAGEAHGSFAGNMADRIDAATTVRGPDKIIPGYDIPANGSDYMTPVRQKTPDVVEPTYDVTHQMPFDRALANRRYLDSNINYTRRGGYEGAPMQEQVRRGAAGEIRAGIRETLDNAAAAGEVNPETVSSWKGGMEDYATSAAVQDPAMANVYQEYGNQKISLPGFLAATSGAEAAGVPGIGLGMAAGQLAKSRGTPLLAGTQRTGQRALEGVASGLDQIAERYAPAAVGSNAKLNEASQPLFEGAMVSHAQAEEPPVQQLPAQHINATVQRVRATGVNVAPKDNRSQADRAVDDAQYGAMLSAHGPGSDRNIVYAELLVKDPAFKERERLRAMNKDHD